MTLPPLTAEGRLPPGRHICTATELYERFVEDAPNRARRELIFRGFLLHRELLFIAGGPLPVWVNGGFVTHKADAPADIDVVYIAADVAQARKILNSDGVYQLLTLQAIWSVQPAIWVDRIQPVGGLVDAFLATPAKRQYWHDTWQHVKGDPSATKGYVEVMP